MLMCDLCGTSMCVEIEVCPGAHHHLGGYTQRAKGRAKWSHTHTHARGCQKPPVMVWMGVFRVLRRFERMQWMARKHTLTHTGTRENVCRHRWGSKIELN